jgi:MFS superfamily sulfate permease-like transporter
MATPQLARLGRLNGSHDYVDLDRHPDAVAPPDLAIWRPAEPLFFGNAEPILSRIAAAQAAEPSMRRLIVSLERTYELDSTALDALLEFDALMRSRGVAVQLARVREEVRDACVKRCATSSCQPGRPIWPSAAATVWTTLSRHRRRDDRRNRTAANTKGASMAPLIIRSR